MLLSPSFPPSPLPSAHSECCTLELSTNKYAALPTALTSRSPIDTICFSSDCSTFWLCLPNPFPPLFFLTVSLILHCSWISYFLPLGWSSFCMGSRAWSYQRRSTCRVLGPMFLPDICHIGGFKHIHACLQRLLSPPTSPFSLFSLNHWNISLWFLCHSSIRSVEIALNHSAFFPDWMSLV